MATDKNAVTYLSSGNFLTIVTGWGPAVYGLPGEARGDRSFEEEAEVVKQLEPDYVFLPETAESYKGFYSEYEEVADNANLVGAEIVPMEDKDLRLDFNLREEESEKAKERYETLQELRGHLKEEDLPKVNQMLGERPFLQDVVGEEQITEEDLDSRIFEIKQPLVKQSREAAQRQWELLDETRAILPEYDNKRVDKWVKTIKSHPGQGLAIIDLHYVKDRDSPFLGLLEVEEIPYQVKFMTDEPELDEDLISGYPL